MNPISIVDAAIGSRMSCRAFTAQAVAPALLAEILDVARWSASGTNSQPWKVYVLLGRARDALVADVCAAHDAVRARPDTAARYRDPADADGAEAEPMVSPYIERRRANGWGLYGVLGIAKGDRDRMHAQHQRNYRFFDAPVGLMFTISRHLANSSLVDYGMFLQSIMVAARARGLHTCAQGAWRGFAGVVLPHIGAPPDERLVCGMAIGHADEADKVNAYRPTREPAPAFTVWLD
ncbi:MAG: nitroreductase [Aquabacterium sp.]